MSDIFLSYASVDKARAAVVATALEKIGYSVWWDADIPPGQRYERVILGALESAKAIVVLWTSASVDSEWVYDEADHGKRKNALVPIQLDQCTPPLGFRTRECAQLADFSGETDNREWQNLLKSLEPLVGRAPLQVNKPLHATKAEGESGQTGNVRYDLSLTLEQAFAGVPNLPVELDIMERKEKKRRSLSLNLPAGIEDNVRIRLAGEGDLKEDRSRGDIYIHVAIAPHPIFKREGADLWSRCQISVATAILGGSVQSRTIDGGTVLVTVPAGTQTGKVLRVPGRGMSKLRSPDRGDLLLELVVETPVNLSVEARRVVEKLRDLIG